MGDLLRLKSRVIFTSDDPIHPRVVVEVLCQVVRPERWVNMLKFQEWSWFDFLCFNQTEPRALWVTLSCSPSASERTLRWERSCPWLMKKLKPYFKERKLSTAISIHGSMPSNHLFRRPKKFCTMLYDLQPDFCFLPFYSLYSWWKLNKVHIFNELICQNAAKAVDWWMNKLCQPLFANHHLSSANVFLWLVE